LISILIGYRVMSKNWYVSLPSQADIGTFGHYEGACSEAAVARLFTCFRSFLSRIRVETNLTHLARHAAGDGSVARPRLVQISGFEYPKPPMCSLVSVYGPSATSTLPSGREPSAKRQQLVLITPFSASISVIRF
jgi:hypothetical protein